MKKWVAGFVFIFLMMSGMARTQTPPEVPPTLAVSPGGTLQWQAVAGAEAYNIYRGTRPDGSDLRCLGYRTAQTEWADPGFPGSPLWVYAVAAWNTQGEGPLGSSSAGVPWTAAVRCADDDGDGVRDDQDNCPGLLNPGQADQNADGRGDPCDPLTYDFETDQAGQRPLEVTQTGGTDATFLVGQFGSDKGVSYNAENGVADSFDRLGTGSAFQDLTVFIDTADLPGEYFGLQLWNEGTYAENAGSDLLLRINPAGTIELYRRYGREYTLLGTAAPGQVEGLRARLVKETGQESTVHLDAWNGTGWNQDVGVIPVFDDHLLLGRRIALTNLSFGRRPLLRITAEPVLPAAPVALRRAFDGLADWKLFQRGPGGLAPIPLPFTYRAAEAARLEARLVRTDGGAVVPGFDFADHTWPLAPAPAGAAASFTLEGVPQGGNYNLEVRLVRMEDGGVLGQDLVANLAVGDVFLAAGQSNMSGYSGTLEPAEPPVATVHMFGNDYAWKMAREPMDDGTNQLDRVSQESPLHSLMLRFAKEVAAGTGVPVAIIPAPLGGTNLYSQWQRSAADPENRGSLYGSAIHRVLAQGYPHPIRGAIWYQGESDAGRGVSAYRADLENLVANFRADLNSPNLFFGNVQLATYAAANIDDWLQIQEAQRQQAVADPLSDVIGIVDQPLSDIIHLNVDGYKETGRRLAMAVLKRAYGKNVLIGPQLRSVKFSSGGRTRIEVTYNKEVAGGAANLYRVADGSGWIQVTGVSVSGNVVQVDLQRAAAASGTKLSYGYTKSPASPWIRATDGSGIALVFYQFPVSP